MDDVKSSVEQVTSQPIIFNLTASDLLSRAIVLAIAIVAAALVTHFLSKLLRRLLDASEVPSASIFVNLGRALVWAFALLAVLQPVFGIQPTAFVTALGVTSLVISFGMQDTVSNVVAGLGLMAGKVVQPGDAVKISGFSGTVVDVNWRSTTVRDRLGNEQVIPNSVLNKTALERLSPGSATLCEVDVAVSLDADLDAVTAEIRAATDEALAGKLAEGQATGVCFLGSDAYGISCAIYLHIIDEITCAAARDALMRKLAGKPWLARA